MLKLYSEKYSAVLRGDVPGSCSSNPLTVRVWNSVHMEQGYPRYWELEPAQPVQCTVLGRYAACVCKQGRARGDENQ